MRRRDFIRLIGGGVVLAAAPGGCAAGPDARAAWRNPGAGEHDPRMRALSWAILAPNPHNMQPWMADLSVSDEVTLYVDPTRLLPVTDPFNRQIVIGCGAFLELLRMAAASEGWEATITPFPDGEPRVQLDARPVARVSFERAAAVSDPLFAQALNRRTSRVAFTSQDVSEAAAMRITREALPGSISAHTLSRRGIAGLKALAKQAARLEADTPAAHRETCERTFFGARDVAAHRYGIALEGPGIEAAHAVGLLTQATMATPGSWAFKQAEGFMDPLADSARGFVWLTTPGNSRAEQVLAGRGYLRQNLAAAAEGLAMHPWSQALQEYPAMRPLYDRLHATLAPGGGRVQMFVRIGHVKTIALPAPRRGLTQNLKT